MVLQEERKYGAEGRSYLSVSRKRRIVFADKELQMEPYQERAYAGTAIPALSLVLICRQGTEGEVWETR